MGHGGHAQRHRTFREGVLHRLGDVGLLALRPGRRPGGAQGLPGGVEDAVLPGPRPQHGGGGPDVLGEVDAEPRDGGLQLGPGAVLEGELALDRARGGSGEQLLLVGPGQRPQRCEAGRVVFFLHPPERQVRPIGEHRLARAPGVEVLVVHPRRGPAGGLLEVDVEGVPAVSGGEHGAAHLEHHEVERGLEVAGEMGLDQGGADGAQVVGQAEADARLLPRLGLRIGGRCGGR